MARMCQTDRVSYDIANFKPAGSVGYIAYLPDGMDNQAVG